MSDITQDDDGVVTIGESAFKGWWECELTDGRLLRLDVEQATQVRHAIARRAVEPDGGLALTDYTHGGWRVGEFYGGEPVEVQAGALRRVYRILVATPKQTAFLDAALRDEYTFLAIGGGIRGGKTFGILMTFVAFCARWPRSRWAIVRVDLPRLRRNVMPAFEKVRATCSKFLGPMNQSTWVATCANGSEILLFPEQADRDPERDRWQGLEVNGFALEEANELEVASFYKAIQRAGAWLIPPNPKNPSEDVEQPPPKILCDFNPCPNWPREYFYEPYMSGAIEAPYFYQPATIVDNPYIDPRFLKNLEDLPGDIYDRYVKGDWSISDEPNQLISARWIEDAQKVEPRLGPQREGVDVAWTGNDWSVFCRMCGNTLINIYGLHGTRDETLAELPQILVKRMAGVWQDPDDEITLPPCYAENVWWDAVGIGAGGYSELRRGRMNIRKFIAGAKPIIRRVPRAPKPTTPAYDRTPTERDTVVIKFANLKAQAYWELREKMQRREIAIPKGFLHPQLREDLLALRYDMKGDWIVTVEDKEDFFKRTGRSPDWAEAFIFANFDPPEVLTYTSEQFESLRR